MVDKIYIFKLGIYCQNIYMRFYLFICFMFIATRVVEIVNTYL